MAQLFHAKVHLDIKNVVSESFKPYRLRKEIKMSRFHLLTSLLVLFVFLGVQSTPSWSKGYHAKKDVERKPDSSFWGNFEGAKKDKADQNIETNLEPLLVRVTGYGAYAYTKDSKSESKRLMAIRASKLDAYRALAERVYGTGISGSSKVNDFVMKHDSFGTVVDSYIRGARVVSISENKGAGFETVLELLLPGNFKDCLSKVNNFRYAAECMRPLPSINSNNNGGASMSKRSGNHYAMESIYYLDR